MIFLSRTETTDRVSSRLSPQNASDCGGLQTIMGYLSMYPSASSPAGFRKSQLTLRVFLVARRTFSFEETPRAEPIFGYRKGAQVPTQDCRFGSRRYSVARFQGRAHSSGGQFSSTAEAS